MTALLPSGISSRWASVNLHSANLSTTQRAAFTLLPRLLPFVGNRPVRHELGELTSCLWHQFGNAFTGVPCCSPACGPPLLLQVWRCCYIADQLAAVELGLIDRPPSRTMTAFFDGIMATTRP